MKIQIEYQDQFKRWHHYQTMNNEANAYRTSVTKAKSTNKRFRLKDDEGSILDIIDP
jgi:uncharacterized protein YukE